VRLQPESYTGRYAPTAAWALVCDDIKERAAAMALELYNNVSADKSVRTFIVRGVDYRLTLEQLAPTGARKGSEYETT
jgi:hypothetical protein